MSGKTFLTNRLSFWPYRVGNGSKTLGGSVWWNDQRVGVEFKFLTREIQIMWEWK